MVNQPFDGSAIVTTAREYLGQKYSLSFDCLDFVRVVYQKHGLTVPPPELNLRKEDLVNPPIGFALYLRQHGSTRVRRWTHVVIIASADSCIHCSLLFGEKVVVTPTTELLASYDVA